MSKAWLAFFILSYSVFCTFALALPTQKPEQVCATCHQSQVADWQTSHHFHAMEVASDSSILGNFDNASLAYQNQTARFFKKDSGLYIEMPNLTGELTTYAVTYTFGYHPLQQYMFDFGNGHYQFFPFAWGSRSKQQGGQRWFVLHPEQTETDAFHWSQKGQNWNHMCADCHSTDFQKNFDFKSNTFNSTFSAINVSCNACHGDSEQHLKLSLIHI